MSNKNRRNRRSAHQRARAEAVTSPETSHVEQVKHLGVSIEVSAAVFQDIEFIEAMLMVEDLNSSDLDKVRSILNAAKMLAGPKWNELIEAIREHNDGRAPIQELRGFVDRCAKAVAPERSAS